MRYIVRGKGDWYFAGSDGESLNGAWTKMQRKAKRFPHYAAALLAILKIGADMSGIRVIRLVPRQCDCGFCSR